MCVKPPSNANPDESTIRDGPVAKSLPNNASGINVAYNSGNSNSASRQPFWMPRRALFAFVANFPCIYIDIVASNYALQRWQLLSVEQKASLPDIVHDNFAFYENHILKEWPGILMYHLIVLGFMVPYDVLGRPPSQHNGSYRRGECTVRFFETRCLLELMRACTVFSTTMSDPHGLHCTEIEMHEMDDIWNTWTFARCGDNIFSGHACHLLSLALALQTYFLPMYWNRHSTTYKLLTVGLWVFAASLSFYVVVSRMHYTVDVLTAVFLVPSVWFAWTGVQTTLHQSNPKYSSNNSNNSSDKKSNIACLSF